MDRRRFLKALSAAGLGCLSSGMKSAQPRPDVLFIFVEDLAVRLGCFGDNFAKTPNIDALAADGMVFENAYCQFPLCNPSRTSILSGLRPGTTAVYTNRDDWRKVLPHGSTLPEQFEANGYETVRIGKVFHSFGGPGFHFDDTDRWTRTINASGANVYYALRGKDNPDPDPPTALYEHQSRPERMKNYHKRAWEWGPMDIPDARFHDGDVAIKAAQIISESRKKPLFLAVGFYEPHLPLRAPRRYFNMYNPDDVILPDYPPDDLEDVPANYNRENHRAFTNNKRRQAIAAYYACVSFIDDCVGRLLRALKNTGRYDNTIIVFCSDHGFHLGEHLLWQKMTLFDESLRVPLIIKPAQTGQGPRICKQLVELVDLYPTLTQLAALPPKRKLDGKGLAPLLTGAAGSHNKPAISQISRESISIRTEKFRYSEHQSPDRAELYDIRDDPRQIHNLANKLSYSEAKQRLAQKLHSYPL